MTSHTEEIIIEKLTGAEDFSLWKFQVTINFKALGLFEIVSGIKLFEGLTKEEEKTDWLRKDARAQKIIVASLEKKIMLHVINCNTSKMMFDKLSMIYERDTEQQKCNLLQEFFSFTYKKDTDMTTHISQLQNLAFKLTAIDQKIDENMLVSKILATLPEEYKYFGTAWESTAQVNKTLNNLTSRLLGEEARIKSTNDNELNSAVAFKISEKKCFICKNSEHIARFCPRNKGNINKRCFICNKDTHLSRSCTQRRKQMYPVSCSICKKTNHNEKDCFFRKKGNDNINIVDRSKVSFFACQEIKQVENFVVDSGSSSHMTSNKDLIKELKIENTSVVIAKKSQSMEAKGIGTIDGETCILNNVLYVPDLTKNLISVNAITENGGEVKFLKDTVVISKDEKKILEGNKQSNGLYVVNINKNPQESFLTEKEDDDDEVDVHRKLGHLSNENIKKLVSLVEGLKLTEKDIKNMDKLCEICMEAKQIRTPFRTERFRAVRPLQIVHSDLCGPITPPTWDGKRYILTFLDDFSHFVMIYLLERKSETEKFVKYYVKEVEAYQNLKLSKLRSDNGGEYISKNFKEWCKKCGIVQDFTISYTPQLNGKAERLNRTILERCRALLLDSSSPPELWGEAALTSVYLLNRSPSQTIDTTPSEKWTGRKPDLSRIQLFGCNAYAKKLGNLKKLDSRSSKMIFVGYSLNGYRLWDPKKREIIISRDVIFSSKKNEDQIKEKKEIVKLRIENEENKEELLQEEIKGNQNVEEIERPKRIRKLPDKFKEFVMLTYEEAMNGPDSEKWREAINEEKTSLKNNNTWKFVDNLKVPKKKIISSKWIFKIKDDGRYRARLVVKGCQQRFGIDYQETFSPVINSSTLRILLAIAAQRRYFIKFFDVKTAFLHGELEEEIFMETPEGYDEIDKVCLLQKALYGLKQAPLKWNQRLTNFLKEKELIVTKSEKCLFKNADNTLFLAIYVDDGIVIGKKKEEIDNLIENLNKEFELVTRELPTTFVGIEVKRNEDFILISQEAYVQSVLETYAMENGKPVYTPIIGGFSDNSKEIVENFPYREAIGSLLYLSSKTRPDIAYAVSYGTRHMDKPTGQDISNVKRTLRYLKTMNYGIKYLADSNSTELIGYSDSDFAGDVETRKSTSGYVIFFGQGPVSWCSRKQPIVSLSSTESEYIAAAECCKELLYLKTLLEELSNKEMKVTLFLDNQSSISLIKNGQFNKRSKHIDVRFQFINEKVSEGLISIEYCSTDNQTADIFTKALNVTKFSKHKNSLMSKIEN